MFESVNEVAVSDGTAWIIRGERRSAKTLTEDFVAESGAGWIECRVEEVAAELQFVSIGAIRVPKGLRTFMRSSRRERGMGKAIVQLACFSM